MFRFVGVLTLFVARDELPVNVYFLDGTCELFRHCYVLPSAKDSQGHAVGALGRFCASYA